MGEEGGREGRWERREGGREGGKVGEEGNDSHVVISVYVSKECVTLKTAAATDNNINS